AWVLGAFLVTGVGFLIAISQHSCGTRSDGVCGYPRLSGEGLHGLQLAAHVLGSLYIALSVLRSVHSRESDRLGDLVTEGRKQRRAEDPFAGTRRQGWDFDCPPCAKPCTSAIMHKCKILDSAFASGSAATPFTSSTRR